MYRCDDCEEECHNQNDLDKHKKICLNRRLPCSLCDQSVASCEMSNHLLRCGNKTIRCPNCSAYVRRGVYIYHLYNNCMDLDEDNTNDRTQSSSTSAKPTTVSSDDVNEDKKGLINVNSHQQQQKTDDEQSFIFDEGHADTGILISCKHCQEHIKFSVFHAHLENCTGLRNRRTPNRAQPNTGHAVCEKEIETTKLLDVVARSMEEPSEKLVTSLEKLNLNPNEEIPNTSTSEKSISKQNPNLLLHEKIDRIRDNLHRGFYPNEVNRVLDKLQFNIVISGSPRVGMSQLINALSGIEDLAKTSRSLDACTKEVKCYDLKNNQQQTPDVNQVQIRIWDTPGVESWKDGYGPAKIRDYIKQTNPVCLIYCAAPGTFVSLDELQVVLKYCQQKRIFCALVCTQMWSGSDRNSVLKEFETQLAFFGPKTTKTFKQGHDQSLHEVILFGKGALCTMVNSKEYHNPDLSDVRKPVQGIDELIHCIMEQLDDEKLLGWCNTVLYNQTYWGKVRQNVAGFASARFDSLVTND